MATVKAGYSKSSGTKSEDKPIAAGASSVKPMKRGETIEIRKIDNGHIIHRRWKEGDEYKSSETYTKEHPLKA